MGSRGRRGCSIFSSGPLQYDKAIRSHRMALRAEGGNWRDLDARRFSTTAIGPQLIPVRHRVWCCWIKGAPVFPSASLANSQDAPRSTQQLRKERPPSICEQSQDRAWARLQTKDLRRRAVTRRRASKCSCGDPRRERRLAFRAAKKVSQPAARRRQAGRLPREKKAGG